MSSAKETMTEIIAQQPEDSTYEEILRELAFAQTVQRGLADSEAGRTLSDEEVKRKIDSWQR
jgi:predicted transcriptional regulator